MITNEQAMPAPGELTVTQELDVDQRFAESVAGLEAIDGSPELKTGLDTQAITKTRGPDDGTYLGSGYGT